MNLNIPANEVIAAFQQRFPAEFELTMANLKAQYLENELRSHVPHLFEEENTNDEVRNPSLGVVPEPEVRGGAGDS